MNTNELSASYEAYVITFNNLKITGLSNINNMLDKHFLIYKTTNVHNGKYYIGQHITQNPYDEYIGSGNLITKAKHKYGLSSFEKQILFDFDNFINMDLKERELVQLSSCFPENQMSYNLMEGGHSGHLTENTKNKLSLSKQGEKNPMHKSHGRKNPATGKTVLERFHYDTDKYEEWRKANSEGHKGLNCGENNYWHKSHNRQMPMNSPEAREKSRLKRIGQKRTLEQRKRISESCKGKNCGKDHVFYGKSLINRLKPETYDNVIKNKEKTNQPLVVAPVDFMTLEEIALWKKHISESNIGTVRIYNPITGQRHRIKDKDKLQKYLNDGWLLGYNCSSIGGKIAIHNPQTNKTKYIYKNELETFLNCGWKRGAYKDPNAIHKIAIHNDIIHKTILIDPKYYVSYYYDGWSLDLPQHKSKGRILIRNEAIHKTKTISKEDLQKYLDDGWKMGRFPNSKKKQKGNSKKKSKFLKFKNLK